VATSSSTSTTTAAAATDSLSNYPRSPPRRRRFVAAVVPPPPPPPKPQVEEERRQQQPQATIIYESPRCQVDDRDLFPAKGAALKRPDERWQFLSRQAGLHRQDASSFRVGPNVATAPAALRNGMPPAAAQRVRSLYLDQVAISRNALPEWLDAVSATFANLEHLYLRSGSTAASTNESSEGGGGGVVVEQRLVDGENAPAVGDSSSKREELRRDAGENTNRLRRLYVLYRLPNLKSIDGVPVTQSERSLSRPDNPNGARVNREDWLLSHADSLADFVDEYDDDEEDSAPSEDDDSDLWINPLGGSGTAATAEGLVEVDLASRLQLVEGAAVTAPSLPIPARRNRLGKKNSSATPGIGAASKLCANKKLWADRERMATSTRFVGGQHTEEEKKDDRCSLSALPHSTKDRQRRPDSPSTSAVACEWSAACGSLSIPYFRDVQCTTASGCRPRLSFRSRKTHRREKSLDDVEYQRNDHPMTETGSRILKEFSETQASQRKSQPQSQKTSPSKPTLSPESNAGAQSTMAAPRAETTKLARRGGTGADAIYTALLPYVSTPPKQEPDYLSLGSRVSPRLSLPLHQSEATTPTNSTRIVELASRNSEGSPRIPPSHSLTSPFPMQFRVRAKLATPTRGERMFTETTPTRIANVSYGNLDVPLPPPPPPTPRTQQAQSCPPPPTTVASAAYLRGEERVDLTSSSSKGGYDTKSRISPPPPPSTPPPSRRHRGGSITLDTSVASLREPIPLTHVQSSPSALMLSSEARRSSLETGALPPTCPKRRMQPELTNSAPRKPRKNKNLRGLWRAKQTARSVSIIDTTDDESDEENADGSDEENIVST